MKTDRIIELASATDKVVIHLDDAAPVRTGPRTFRKRVLRPGKWAHNAAPGGVLDVDTAYMQALADNFSSGVWDTVAVPFGHPKNEADAALSNAGHVTALEVAADGLYAILDIDPAHADKIGKTIKGCSAGILPSYTDHEVGGKGAVGPVLAHVALTNEPYIKGLGDFEGVTLAEAAAAPGTLLTPLAPPKETPDMTYEEMLAKLKADHNIDVAALLAIKPAEPVDIAAITQEASTAAIATLGEALVAGGVITLAEGTTKATTADVLSAIRQVAENGKAATIELAETKASAFVSKAIAEGRVLPAKADAVKALYLSDSAAAEALFDTKLVELGAEYGTHGIELTDPATGALVDVAATIDRYAEMAKSL